MHKDVFSAHLTLHWHWVVDKLGFLFDGLLSDSPKLTMVVEELRRFLGGSDTSLKLFTKFWHSYGHPRSYVSQREAELAVKLSELKAAVSVNPQDSMETLSTKVKLLAGTSLSGHIWEVTVTIEQGKIEHLEEALQTLTSVLAQSGLMKSNKSAT
ncbi:unnamed protein product, partial [Lymnaea stagnalis]